MKTAGPCRIDGCNRLGNVPGSADGLCRPHYQRQRADQAGPCSVKGCANLTRAKGMCPNHLSRLKRHGPLELPSVEDKFWALVDRRGDEECWPWLGRVGTTGYGRLDPKRGMNLLAHRYSYELHVGRIPDGLTIDHLCRVTTCVNPSHLEPVTVAENARREHESRRLTRKASS